jgi:iron complex transport system substrate-binding protein
VKAVTAVNVAGLALALTASTAVAWVPSALEARGGWRGSAAGMPAAPPTAVPGDSLSPPADLVDHAGFAVRRRDYRRIASGSALADALLLELCEPDRVVAFTAYSARGSRAYRYAGKATIERLDDVEAVLGLHADLVLVNEIGDARISTRLREAGVAVYDLGERRGLSTLLPNVREVSELVGHPERGDRLARSIEESMRSLADGVPAGSRRSAMYLSVYGGKLFGGGGGTSYHDVLTAAGLVDAASDLLGWPEYSTEQVAILDPDLIVTNAHMRERICEHAGLSSLRACERAGGVVEIDGDLLGDPGPGIVDAARAVRDRAYGAPPPSALTMRGRGP